MAHLMFRNRARGKEQFPVEAIFAYEGENFFAKHLPKGIESLATVQTVKGGFLIRPDFNLVMSVTNLHRGGKGCCRILFARMDRKKKGGKKLGFAKEVKQRLIHQFYRTGGQLSDLGTSLRHVLVYRDEMVIGKSLDGHTGAIVKKGSIFRSHNPDEGEAQQILAVSNEGEDQEILAA